MMWDFGRLLDATRESCEKNMGAQPSSGAVSKRHCVVGVLLRNVHRSQVFERIGIFVNESLIVTDNVVQIHWFLGNVRF